MDLENFGIREKELVIEEGDYVKDGLLYCGKCHTQKQFRGVILGKVRVVTCACKCEKEKFEEDQKKRKEQERLDRIHYARKEAFSGRHMESWTFENDDRKNEDLSNKMKNYADNFKEFFRKGRGIMLYGPTGTGKTYMACCVANEVIDKGYSVLVKNFNEISNELFSTPKKDEYMERISNVDLLVVDDLSMERESQYMNEVVYSVIDGRCRTNKPVIVTTNLMASSMKDSTDIEKRRIYSRLVEICIPIMVKGSDRRFDSARTNFDDDLKILNGVVSYDEKK